MSQDGEYLSLWFDNGWDAEYVRGHVTKEIAIASAEREHGPFNVDMVTTHKWARWEFPTETERDQLGFDRTFRPLAEKQRGAFPVTEIRPAVSASREPT